MARPMTPNLKAHGMVSGREGDRSQAPGTKISRPCRQPVGHLHPSRSVLLDSAHHAGARATQPDADAPAGHVIKAQTTMFTAAAPFTLSTPSTTWHCS